MKKRIRIVIALMLLTVPICVVAHPGKTDSNGGHHDYDNVSGLGSYHYHHGYPAHLHENGICPYDYDDQTDHSTDSTSNSITGKTLKPYYKPSYYSAYSEYGNYDVYLSYGIFHLPGCPEAKPNGFTKPLDEVTAGYDPCTYCKPLKYSSYEVFEEKELGRKPDESDTQVKKGHHSTDILLYSTGGIACLYGGYQILMNKKKKKARDTKSKNEYDYYFSCYAFYNPEDFVDIPKGTYIKDGLPCSSGSEPYGIYTAYVTKKGNKYHRRESCSKSPYLHKTNLVNAMRLYDPCKRCVNCLPDLSWYKEYLRIKRIKETYDIP